MFTSVKERKAMEVNLSIDAATCIKCGKCADVCPSKIIRQKEKQSDLMLVDVHLCISCGHCVSVCPTNSVCHSAFPSEKVHPFNYEGYPSEEQMMLLCKARRSNRAFSKKKVPPHLIDKIIEASHTAPSASNSRQISYTVVTDPKKLQMITEFTLSTFDSIKKKLTFPLLKPLAKLFLPEAYRYTTLFRSLNEAYYDQGEDLILRKATGIILYHTPKSYRFGVADANLAYQNGSLMAECLGVNQFYLGFVCTAIQLNKGKLEELLEIEGTIHAGMAIGLPRFRFPNYVDREEIRVTTFD